MNKALKTIVKLTIIWLVLFTSSSLFIFYITKTFFPLAYMLIQEFNALGGIITSSVCMFISAWLISKTNQDE